MISPFVHNWGAPLESPAYITKICTSSFHQDGHSEQSTEKPV
jgi:hypothetical protein